MTEVTYSFTASQELTKEQLDYLNSLLLTKLPTSDKEKMLDIPEWITEISLNS